MRRILEALVAAALLVAAMLAAMPNQTARAQQEGSTVPILRFGFGGEFAAAGSIATDYETMPPAHSPMKFAGGAYFLGDVAMGRHVLFEPRIDWRSIRAEGIAARGNLFVFALGLGIRHQFEPRTPGGLSVEPLLTVHVGIAGTDREFLGAPRATTSFEEPDTLFGFNVAVRAGTVFWLRSGLGLSIALGYHRSEFFPQLPGGGRGRATIQQGLLDFGLVINT